MTTFSKAFVVAASLFAAISASPLAAQAEPASNDASQTDNPNDKKHPNFRTPHKDKNATENGAQETVSGAKKFDKKHGTPDNGAKFGSGTPNNGLTSPFKTNPSNPTVLNGSKSNPSETFSKTQGPDDNQIGSENNGKSRYKKHFGDKNKDLGTGNNPVVINPTLPKKHFGDKDKDFNSPPIYTSPSGFPSTKPPSGFPLTKSQPGFPSPVTLPAGGPKSFDAIKSSRKEKSFAGGKGTVIEESDKRKIFKQNDHLVIQHDDTERLRRVAPNARFEKGAGGTTVSIIDRPGNVKIYSETDANGQLLRRYRRGPDGRDVIIIDNRRRRHGPLGKDIAIGARHRSRRRGGRRALGFLYRCAGTARQDSSRQVHRRVRRRER